MSIQMNQELRMKNVITFRGKLTQQQIQEEMVQLAATMKEMDAKQVGDLITVTYGVEGQFEVLFDVGIFVPIDKCEMSGSKYEFQNEILLSNMVYMEHEGDFSTLQVALDKVMEYMKENNLTPKTPPYIGQPLNSKEKKILNIYVGV